MGCFDKTCCLTNTSISSGEKCLIVMLNPTAERYERTFYDVCNLVYRQAERESQELKFYEKSLIEKNDYKIGDFLPFRNCVVGTYDDYGGIEEDLLPEDYEEIREKVQFYHV